jgi:mono/diheme cytochrome c family protein
MSLLLPELERQLRKAARHLSAAATAEDLPPSPARRGRPLSVLVPAFGVGVALVIGVVAVLLVHHRVARPVTAGQPGAATSRGSATGSSCSPGSVSLVGRPASGAVLARGTIGAMPWSLTAAPLPGAAAAANGVVRVAGHRYRLCGALELTLLGAPRRGLAIAFLPAPTDRDIRIDGRPPTVVRHVPGGALALTLFARPACRFGRLTLSAAGDGTSVGADGLYGGCPKPWVQLVSGAVGVKGTSPGGVVLGVEPPPGLGPGQIASFERGEIVFGDSGCLACHQLAGTGNNGPGRRLTSIGRQLTAAELSHQLLDPRAPMPSFKGLSKSKLRDLVFFLSQLGG